MSGIFQRMSMIFRAKADKTLDKMEDPRQTLDYSYQRQLELLQKVRRGVADVATSRKRLELQMKQLQQGSDKLTNQAQAALAQGREDLAREALARDLDDLDRIALFPSTVDALRVLARGGFRLVVITNQSGIALGLFDEPFVRRTHDALQARLDDFDVHPSGPLWGRGELRSTEAARATELAALEGDTATRLRNGLENAGLEHERRALRMRPLELAWRWLAQDALASFHFQTAARMPLNVALGRRAALALASSGR